MLDNVLSNHALTLVRVKGFMPEVENEQRRDECDSRRPNENRPGDVRSMTGAEAGIRLDCSAIARMEHSYRQRTRCEDSAIASIGPSSADANKQ